MAVCIFNDEIGAVAYHHETGSGCGVIVLGERHRGARLGLAATALLDAADACELPLRKAPPGHAVYG
jgi:hypothetical protein